MSTDQLLLTAAADLVAEHGVDDVTVGEITRAAGQRNGAAVHYHFGGRDGLLDAIVREHHELLDAARAERLRVLDASDDVGIRDYVEVIVEPMVAFLATNRGRAFLRIQADRFLDDRSGPMAASMSDIAGRLAQVMPAADAAMRTERTLLTTLLINVRLGRAAADGQPEPEQIATLSSTLVAAVAAVLTGKET